jgi:hypothetical protein
MKKYKGKLHSKWNGGRIMATNGYVLIYSPKHPNRNKMGKGYVLEHRLIMEKSIGRFLTKREIVHHINGQKTDNRIENLVLTTNSKHVAHHKHIEGCSDSAKIKHTINVNKLKRNDKGQFIGLVGPKYLYDYKRTNITKRVNGIENDTSKGSLRPILSDLQQKIN